MSKNLTLTTESSMRPTGTKSSCLLKKVSFLHHHGPFKDFNSCVLTPVIYWVACNATAATTKSTKSSSEVVDRHNLE